MLEQASHDLTAIEELSQKGQKAAARFLQDKGYEILAQNWSCVVGSIDIVARDEDDVCFIEVQTRSGVSHGFPEMEITREYRARLESIAALFLAEMGEGYTGCRIRFDEISLMAMDEQRAFLRHRINRLGNAS